jgi:hypothetical protein
MKSLSLFLLLVAAITSLVAADVCGFCDDGDIKPRNGKKFELGNTRIKYSDLSDFIWSLADESVGGNCDAILDFFGPPRQRINSKTTWRSENNALDYVVATAALGHIAGRLITVLCTCSHMQIITLVKTIGASSFYDTTRL